MRFASSRISVENVTAGPKTPRLPKRFRAAKRGVAEPACLAVGHEFVAFILTAIRARVRKRRRKRLEMLISAKGFSFIGLQGTLEHPHLGVTRWAAKLGVFGPRI